MRPDVETVIVRQSVDGHPAPLRRIMMTVLTPSALEPLMYVVGFGGSKKISGPGCLISSEAFESITCCTISSVPDVYVRLLAEQSTELESGPA